MLFLTGFTSEQIIPFQQFPLKGIHTCTQLGGGPAIPDNQEQLRLLFESLSKSALKNICDKFIVIPAQRSKNNATKWIGGMVKCEKNYLQCDACPNSYIFNPSAFYKKPGRLF